MSKRLVTVFLFFITCHHIMFSKSISQAPVVRSRPRIADPHIRTVSFPAESTARLACEAQGEPKPSITWTKVATGTHNAAHTHTQLLQYTYKCSYMLNICNMWFKSLLSGTGSRATFFIRLINTEILIFFQNLVICEYTDHLYVKKLQTVHLKHAQMFEFTS